MFTTSDFAARHTQLMSILNVCINVNANVKCYCNITTMFSTACNESDKQKFKKVQNTYVSSGFVIVQIHFFA